MTGDVTLQPMRWWHIHDVHDLERQLFSPDTWSQETFWSELAAPGRRYTVATTPADEVVGYCGLFVSGADADVQTIAVAPRGQGNGLGRRLLGELVDRALAEGATTVLLEVRADNEPAVALYRGAGFERIAVRHGYYQPGGIDAHVMRLRPIRTSPLRVKG